LYVNSSCPTIATAADVFVQNFVLGVLGDYYRILPPGDYEVIVTADGYEPAARNVTVTNKVRDSAMVVDFALKPLAEQEPSDEEIAELVEALQEQQQE
ncbi:hypothetical protein COOONC_26783, partial [Cooperia oncophora]